MMNDKNLIVTKTYTFALQVIELYRFLCKDKKEYVLSKQLLRSGTSIGANVNEAQAAISKKDFIAKMSISSKEARESKYWIDLLVKTEYLSINDQHTKSLVNDIEEIIKLLTSIVKSSKENS